MVMEGPLTFLLSLTVATAAYILSWIGGLVQCQFIKFTDVDGTMSIHFGIFYYQSFHFDGDMISYGSCIQYPDYVNIDSSWKASRAFSVLSLLFGTFFLVVVIAATCAKPDRYKSIIGPGFFLAAICQGFSLLVLNSSLCKNNAMMKELRDTSSAMEGITFQETCSISTGAHCVISATVLYFVASILSLVARAIEHEYQDRVKPQNDQLLEEPFLVNQASIFFNPAIDQREVQPSGVV